MVDEKRSLIALLLASCVVTASTLATGPFPLHEAHAKASQTSPMKIQPWLVSAAMVTFLALPSPAFAEEFNYSIQSTGETVEICTKRGPLGACLKTEMRTSENDNDKSQKYFRDQGDLIREKEEVLRGSASTEGNDLINKLKKQTEENREKNELYVQRKTFENNQAANFGPFDKQVVILNTDGKTFTLLQNPQAMRLKQAGFIEGRQFVKQPTAEEIEAALTPDGPGLAERILGIFGSD